MSRTSGIIPDCTAFFVGFAFFFPLGSASVDWGDTSAIHFAYCIHVGREIVLTN